MGGFWTMLPAVVAHIFGRKQYLSAYSFITIFIFIRSAGYVITGYSSNMTGSYDTAYYIYMVMLFLGYILILNVRKEDWNTSVQ